MTIAYIPRTLSSLGRKCQGFCGRCGFQERQGYFVSVDLVDGCAAEVVRLAGEVGVKLTPAGATYPLGHDPRDRNLRIAPTMPSVDEVELAMEVFCACVDLASARKLRERAG